MIVATALLVATATGLVAMRLLSIGSVRRPTPSTALAPERDRRRPPIPARRRTPRAVQPAALASWADDLARALRHGSTLHAALTHTMPTDAVVDRRSAPLRHWLGRGATVVDACDEWADELAGDSVDSRYRRGGRVELLATMAAVLAAVASLGGPAAAPLDRFAVTMRQRASDDLERAAQAAQAKMSAKVLTSVPLAVLALLFLTDPDVREIITSTAGGTVVALGLGLNAAGARWMRRIAGSSGRVAR